MNINKEKIKKIEELNKQLNLPKELGGVFLPEDSRSQFDFMFIGEMPSKNKPKDWDGRSNYNFGKFDPMCKFLQEMMIKYGVAGSYITDIVKSSDVPRRPTREEIENWKPFLIKEIEIIQPKAIVVLGKTTYYGSFKPFFKNLIPKEIIIDWAYHYSQRGSKTNREVEAKFAEVISEIKERISGKRP